MSNLNASFIGFEHSASTPDHRYVMVYDDDGKLRFWTLDGELQPAGSAPPFDREHGGVPTSGLRGRIHSLTINGVRLK